MLSVRVLILRTGIVQAIIYDIFLFFVLLKRSTYSLKYPMETVCLALERDNNLFAVGSQSHVSFYDPRSGTAVGYIGSRDPGAGESRRGGKETLSL